MPSTRAAYHWTTTNLGEAAPGVLTPLSLAVWGAPGERGARWAEFEIGVLKKEELAVPEDPAEWILRLFYGRLTMRLESMALVGDRFPGTSGREAIRGMFGEAPPGMTFNPTRERYPAIAVKFTRAFLTYPARLRRLADEQDRWWRESIARLDSLDRQQALELFAAASGRFERTAGTQLLGTLCSVQPMYEALEKLIEAAGTGDISVLSGTGGAEMAVVSDIWRASRGELRVEDVVATHGFHGPGEGELSSTVWREDAAPLRRLIEQYATRDDSESPIAREADRAAELVEAQRELIAALPRLRRAPARLVLRLAAQRIPHRGIAKASFLRVIDVARASARRAGDHFVAEGVLADRDDVFMLTPEELTAPLPDDVGELVAARRARRAEYQQFELASATWEGLPEKVPVSESPAAGEEVSEITGTGVSGGVVEGTVRVVTDPSFTEVEPDEVLVAPTTDPSWSSIMFISSALVVDIGGALSHAAVVARELQIPCVVDTGNGTELLSTGDRVRVDGDRGVVEVLERAAGGSEDPAEPVSP
jgi:phosphohistidine swiveling domain-containing protein